MSKRARDRPLSDSVSSEYSEEEDVVLIRYTNLRTRGGQPIITITHNKNTGVVKHQRNRRTYLVEFAEGHPDHGVNKFFRKGKHVLTTYSHGHRFAGHLDDVKNGLTSRDGSLTRIDEHAGASSSLGDGASSSLGDGGASSSLGDGGASSSLGDEERAHQCLYCRSWSTFQYRGTCPQCPRVATL